MNGGSTKEHPDVFICHASEDKEGFVRPLAECLRDAGLRVWYDEFSVNWGDSLVESIDDGLRTCGSGIVVLSPQFFAKNWSRRELNGLITRELGTGDTMILPIWHGVTRDDVARYSLPLADKLALDSSLGVAALRARLIERIRVLIPARGLELPRLSRLETFWEMEHHNRSGLSPRWRQFDPTCSPPVFSSEPPIARCSFLLAKWSNPSDGISEYVLQLVCEGPESARDVRFGQWPPSRPKHIELLLPGEQIIAVRKLAQDEHFDIYATWSDSLGRHRTKGGH